MIDIAVSNWTSRLIATDTGKALVRESSIGRDGPSVDMV